MMRAGGKWTPLGDLPRPLSGVRASLFKSGVRLLGGRDDDRNDRAEVGLVSLLLTLFVELFSNAQSSSLLNHFYRQDQVCLLASVS